MSLPMISAVCREAGGNVMRKSRQHARSAAADALLRARPTGPTKRSAHHTLLFGVVKNKRAVWTLIIIAALAIATVASIILYTDLSLTTVTEWVEGLNAVAVLPLMALLPIAGFPIVVVYLVAGARFGPVWGGAVVAGVTAVHLLGTFLIARSFLRAPLQRFIEKRNVHLPQVPEDEQAAICLIAALVPGLPYVVRNYALALAGVRLKYYLGVCLPVYVARSYVTILLGDMSSDPTRTKIIVLVIVDVLKVAICALVIWRLRVHHRKYHGHSDHDHGPDAVSPPNAAAK
jgi:uncharacterized membrane protein YdjX (TVP38/TMEM64 family)